MCFTYLWLFGIRVISPFGKSKTANVIYGILVFSITLGLFIFKYGLDVMLNDFICLGGIFAVIYTVSLGLWTNRRRK